ncbi:MAG: DUF1501 domain-containing protein [Deltaproteobacteria bacterium]|nr:DUF1501 domain-containing protein [Deltaproteobacteria bacterium]
MPQYYSRRDFLRTLGKGAGSLAAMQMLRPSCLMADTPNNPNGTIKYLILLVMDGGYDGHTIFPFTDDRQDIMALRRPTIGIPKANVLGLNGAALGLNPALTGLHAIHGAGNLKLLGGVGTAGASASHEDAKQYYSDGGKSLTPSIRYGHIARLANTYSLNVNQVWGLLSSNTRPDFRLPNGYAGLQVNGKISGFTYQNRDSDLGGSTAEGTFSRSIVTSVRGLNGAQSPLEERFAQAIDRLETNVPVIQAVAARVPGTGYPDYNNGSDPDFAAISNNKRVIDAFIDADRVITDRVASSDTTPVIIQISWGGFDDHADLTVRLGQKMRTLDRLLAPFRAHMTELGVWDKTAIYGYSEFNRTLSENGALNSEGAGTGGGTDHSQSNIHFLVGGRVAGGNTAVVGSLPSLEFIDMRRVNRTPSQSAWINNGMPYSIDYRDVLSQLVQAMGFDTAPIYPENFPHQNLQLFT